MFRSHSRERRTQGSGLCGSVLVFMALTVGTGCGRPQNKAPVEAPATNLMNAASSSGESNVLPSSGRVAGENEFDIDKSTEHLTKGNEFLSAGKLQEAIEQFTLAVQFNPEDEDLYYNLALAQARFGNIEGAKKNYEKALQIYPDYVEAHNNLGNLLVNEGKFDEAIRHFEKAVEHDAANAAAHNNLGNAYARQKKYAQSLIHFQTAVELKADYPEAQFNLGNAYLLLGRVDEAINEFTRLLRLHPDFTRAQTQLDKALAARSKQNGPTNP